MAGEVLVFAASSLTNAMSEVAQSWELQSGHDVKLSFASSSTLARQIEHGAEADIYASANIRWMDYIEDKKFIFDNTRTPLLTNQLVLIAAADGDIDRINAHEGFPLADLLGGGHLAMGNPAHVPAGLYGKQVLQSLGVWSKVKPQVARAANVRAALALVATGEAPLGIVYRTDAMVSDQVAIIATFPATTHDPVIYPIALTRTSEDNPAARSFFRYLQSDAAARVFARYGFSPASP